MKKTIAKILDFICEHFTICAKYLCFPLCLVLMIIKRLKGLSQDIKWFNEYKIIPCVFYYDDEDYLFFNPTNLRDFKYLIKYSLNNPNDYLNEIIPCDWCDKPELIRDILFAFIIDFVEEEKCFQYNSYTEKQKSIGNSIKKIYNYIKNRESNKFKKALIDLCKISPKFFCQQYLRLNYDQNYQHIKTVLGDDFNEFIIDTAMETLDQIICKKIVDIREHLWV